MTKKTHPLQRSAAAVYVITNEDIRRSGVTTVADALRMVPGVNVARVGSHTWAISTRGFNSVFANKLLVMIDGRNVYTPLFAGVYWDDQDVVLEDIERIEVIRGPGATLWGANAVNGVINIITKHASDTEGGLVVAGFGDEERAFGTLRYGGTAGAHAYYRVYVKAAQRDDSRFIADPQARDGWWTSRVGYRLDWDGGAWRYRYRAGRALLGTPGHGGR